MSDVTRSAKEGLGFGLIAGVVFAVAQVAATLIGGEPAIAAFRRIGSVLLGPEALVVTPAATVVGVAIIGHLFLAAMFGLFYGLYNSALTMPTRRSVVRQVVVGMIFGVMLWLVNFQVFARARYPWLLEQSQLVQIILHAVCFGLPLAVLYATAERHAFSARPARARA